MSERPSYVDFTERGFGVILLGPVVLVVAVLMLPFALVGMLTHRVWPVERDADEGGL